jgi:hypothetical protein
MSSINDVSNSLLSSLLLNNQQTDSAQDPTQTTNGNTTTPASGSNDVVSLSNYINEIQNDPLFNIEGQGGTESDNSIYNLLSGNQGSSDSSDSLYNIMLSDENAKLMQANPSLVQDIISEEQSQTTDSGSSSSTSQSLDSQALQDIENTNLITMSPDTLISLLQKYTSTENPASQTTPGTQVNQIV